MWLLRELNGLVDIKYLEFLVYGVGLGVIVKFGCKLGTQVFCNAPLPPGGTREQGGVSPPPYISAFS